MKSFDCHKYVLGIFLGTSVLTVLVVMGIRVHYLSEKMFYAVGASDEAFADLLNQGADIEREFDSQTCLNLAVREDDVDMAQLLLKRGADPDHATLGFEAPRALVKSEPMRALFARYRR